MASSPPNPREAEELGATPERSEAAGGERAAAPQKRFIAPPASQIPSRLQYVSLGPTGPAGVKSTFRTVKVARRVPTLPRKLAVTPGPPGPAASTSTATGASSAASATSSVAPTSGTPAASSVASTSSLVAPAASTSSTPVSSLPLAAVATVEPTRRARRDQAKRHACETCSKRFTSPGKLSQHVLSHTGELPFPCEYCEKRFNSKFKLHRHNLIHTEARAFACNVCGKTFNRKDHLTNHERVHNPVKKLYTCEKADCRKSYTSSMSYRKHAALHSVEEGNLQCTICDKVFTNRQDIVYHLKIHTGSRSVKNETDKKFTCPYCDRRFFTAKDVRRHLVVHTGRRDFLCPHCPQKFGRKDHLVRHVKNAHPDESWRSAAVGTSSEPAPEASAFEETYTSDYPIEGTDYEIWKAPSPKEGSSEPVQTPVPSSNIIVEISSDLNIKMEPEAEVKVEVGDTLEIKLEQPASPSCTLLPVDCDYPLVYVVPQQYSQEPTALPYITAEEELPDSVEAHLLDPNELFDPGEGPSGLSSQVLQGLLEENEPTYAEESTSGRTQQRLPAFTQAFHTAQSSKPPPPPPPPH